MYILWNLLGALAITQTVLANPVAVPVCAGQDKLGAVASESSICSKIGIDLLKAGGNAADAVSTYLAMRTTTRC